MALVARPGLFAICIRARVPPNTKENSMETLGIIVTVIFVLLLLAAFILPQIDQRRNRNR